jgi:hypothetical protein
MNYQNSYQYPAQDVDTEEDNSEMLGEHTENPTTQEIKAVIPESGDEVPDGDSPEEEAGEDESNGDEDDDEDEKMMTPKMTMKTRRRMMAMMAMTKKRSLPKLYPK